MPYDLSVEEIAGDGLGRALTQRAALDPAKVTSTATDAQESNAGAVSSQPRTSASVTGGPSLSVSSLSVSSILQGAALYKPAALQYDQFNQYLSSDMQSIIQTGGGADQILGQGRQRFTPYDILVQQGRSDGKIQFEGFAAGGDAANEMFAGAADGVAVGAVQQTDGSETHPHSQLGPVTVLLWTVTDKHGKPWTFKMAAEFMAMWQPCYKAALADGVNLTGGGFRTEAGQIALRKQNCGESVWQTASSSSCRPPTAKPGKSNHEKGLAIDLHNAGSRGTEAYQWMAANAGRFGIKNLPSESWHWSINGN